MVHRDKLCILLSGDDGTCSLNVKILFPFTGTCVADDQGVRCECRSGFVGARCDTEAEACKHDRCFNGATCIPRK